MNEETFKYKKGTFHYEPVVWGDWKEGDEVIFDEFVDNLHDHWAFTEGESYIIDFDDIDIGPRSDKGEIPSCDWGFKFSRKVYDVVEDLNIKTKDKKWNEYPFSFPPVNTLVLVEYDTVQQEWYKGFVLALGDDADGEFCQFQWLEGPKTNQTSCYYTPESFKPLLPIENQESEEGLHECNVHILTLDEAILHAEGKSEELRVKNQIPCADNHKILANWLIDYRSKLQEKDSIKQGKSLDNLLKELHNLKQEQKAISNKIDNILNEINDAMKENGLAVVFTEKFNPHEYRA